MLRSVLSAIAFAGVLAAASPVFAEPVAVAASDHAQATTQTVRDQPALSDHDCPPPSTATAPANLGRDRNDIPVGFGWG